MITLHYVVRMIRLGMNVLVVLQMILHKHLEFGHLVERQKRLCVGLIHGDWGRVLVQLCRK